MAVHTEKLCWIYTVTPLHLGTGQGTGYVDLPILREKVTHWPLISGSSLKGALASHFSYEAQRNGESGSRKDNDFLRAAFGLADSESDELGGGGNAGSLMLSDGRLCCMPVRAFRGSFAWVASPLSLQRVRSMDSAAPEALTAGLGTALCCPGSVLIDDTDRTLYLADLDVACQASDAAGQWADFIASSLFAGDPAWAKIFKERFAVVDDDLFTFLCETGTQVDARIRLEEDRKMVKQGALWYEESVPCEAVFAASLWCDRVYGSSRLTGEDLVKRFTEKPLEFQLGGKASVGRGRLRVTFR